MDSLYNFINGKATISDHSRNIWYLSNLIDKYGDDDALKLFTVFQYVVDLRPTNPFANVAEHEKLETVIRSVCPELSISIDWDDIEITECVELTRKLFETSSYRNYLASKILADKINYKIEHTYVDLTKEGGNSGEIKKGYDLFTSVTEQTKKIYQEFLDEQPGTVQIKGRGKQLINRNPGGKSKELE